MRLRLLRPPPITATIGRTTYRIEPVWCVESDSGYIGAPVPRQIATALIRAGLAEQLEI